MKTAPALGTWLSIGSPVVAELAALSGFDWVLLDLEHGCASEAALPDQLRALHGTSTKGIVRVSAPAPDQIARVLDWGAHGIMVPNVESAAAAAAIVQATRYPPHGRRGLSRTVRAHGYGLRTPAESSASPLVFAQIESLEGVRHAPSIAATPGIDVLFIGPADLRHNLENSPAQPRPGYPECLASVLEAAGREGKSTGILLRDSAELTAHLDLGFTHPAIQSDLAILRQAYQTILTQAGRCA